jgi:acetyl-CoA acetyltransferase
VKGWHAPPLGRIRAFAFAGLSPRRMGLGPVFAISKALERAKLSALRHRALRDQRGVRGPGARLPRGVALRRLRRGELARERALGEIPLDILNVNGGAIALGHPVGSSGARLCSRCSWKCGASGSSSGCAALCVGGGQGAAFILERDG